MTITNGYCSLAEIKEALRLGYTYSATTLSFASATKKIADTLKGLKRFQTGDFIQISGSLSNDGYYTIATGDVPGEIVVSESLADEAAGRSVTITVRNDLTDDATLERAVEAVSRTIDRHCKRRFYTTATDETRYYTAENALKLWCEDDILSVTTLKTDAGGAWSYGYTWSATDYALWPYNAALDGEPYTAIEAAPNGSYRFPLTPKGVKITGKFGYSATTPPAVKAACLLQCERLYKRRDAPFGVLGAAGMGQLMVIPELDPDVALLLRPFVRKVP